MGSAFHDAGSKAGRLRELEAIHMPVPPFFIVLSRGGALNLTQEIAKIGGFPVAARSSGTIEDLGDASFAGMYESVLGIKDETDLKNAIEECFNSSQSERVREYLKTHQQNVTRAELEKSMRVMVQKMVPAERAGVLFTIDPVLGQEELFYIEVCAGLGERLVSGHVTPSRYRYHWSEEEISSAEINDEGTRLTDNELKVLARLALEIQTHYGQPQDIEWAIDPTGKIWILQARPVTHVAWRRDVPELTNADLKDGGISARVCPPMMYSLYQRALQSSMGRYFEDISLLRSGDAYQWMYHLYGRGYWNAGVVKEALKCIPGYDEKVFDQGLGITKDYGLKGPEKTGITPQSILVALNALAAVKFEYQNCERMLESFPSWFEEQDQKLRKRVESCRELSDRDFWQLVHEVDAYQFRTETSYFRTIYNNSNFQTDLKNKIARLNPNCDLLKLLSGLEKMSHMDIQSDLENLKVHEGQASFAEALNQFLKNHYHHGDVELDLTVPRWGENPARIVEMLKDVKPTQHHSNESWQDEWNRLDHSLHNRWSWYLFEKARVKRQLLRARHYLTQRESMRAYSTRAYYLVRKLLLEGEQRLGLKAGEVHLLKFAEFVNQDIPNKKEWRKRDLLLKGYRHFEAPNEFGGALTISKDTSGLQGIGCSSGIVEAQVRVVLDLSEANLLLSGEVLVTKFTDPGWTPTMARASAIITEVGGVLSHAAVIGREYGIPAVLNLTGATKKLKTGMKVRVDGRTGVVEILK